MAKKKKDTQGKPGSREGAGSNTWHIAVIVALLFLAGGIRGGYLVTAEQPAPTAELPATALLARVIEPALPDDAVEYSAEAATPVDVTVPACSDDPSVNSADCQTWAAMGECDNNPPYMNSMCAASCGCRGPPPAVPECVDKDKTGSCHHWAASGECENNPAYMKLRCAASCNTCDLLDYSKRCPMPANRSAAVPAGKMDEIFERALTQFTELEPKVLSHDPWVLSFDRFLSPDEVDAVLEHGEGRYIRSTASGGRKDDEFIPLTSEVRTSWTTWCDNKTCLEDPRIMRITERVADVTQVPSQNFEFMQLLRYYACEHARAPDCQFYRRHHDTIPELEKMQPGPRVFTFFLYLSDVEEGGGTKFDGGFTVQPKAGRALFWPATLPHEPFTSDDRTHHEALPVTKGIKYAANFWLHQYDYVSAHHSGCTS